MKDIYELLRQKEAQLQLLARQVEALRIAVKLLEEEQALLGKPVDQKELSQPEMIRHVLRDRGEPMHVSEIAEAIRKKFGKKLKAAYITSVVYRLIKLGKHLYKVEGKPNTFGLLEWRVSGESKLFQMDLNRSGAK